MKKIFGILLLCFVATGLMFGCTEQKDVEDNNLSSELDDSKNNLIEDVSLIKDCGVDLACFIDEVNESKLSKVTFSTTIDIFGGMKQISVNYFEMKSYEGDLAEIYLRLVETTVEYSPETPQETIDMSKKIYDSMVGLDGVCELKKSDLLVLLNKWSDGNFSSADWDNATCSGSYFEPMIVN